MQSLAFSDDKLKEWLSEVSEKDYNVISENTTEAPQNPSGAGGAVVYASSAPNNPKFDINQVSWGSFPQYVQDILNIDIQKAYSDYSSSSTAPFSLNLPLCIIRVGKSNYQIWVCQNVAIGYYFKNSTPDVAGSACRLISLISDSSTSTAFKPSVVYTATFSVSSNAVVSDWSEVAGSSWSSTNMNFSTLTVKSYVTLNSESTSYDFYYYGSSNPLRKANILDYGSTYHPNVPNTGSLRYKVGIFSPTNSPYLVFNQFDNGSTATFFSPPSPETQAENTRKGIWETIKSLPSMFLDMLKSLFIPEDDFFAEWFNNMTSSIDEHLGVIGQVITFPLKLLNLISEHVKNAEMSSTLVFPAIKVRNFTTGKDIKLTDSTAINLQDIIDSNSYLGELWAFFRMSANVCVWIYILYNGYEVFCMFMKKRNEEAAK